AKRARRKIRIRIKVRVDQAAWARGPWLPEDRIPELRKRSQIIKTMGGNVSLRIFSPRHACRRFCFGRPADASALLPYAYAPGPAPQGHTRDSPGRQASLFKMLGGAKSATQHLEK